MEFHYEQTLEDLVQSGLFAMAENRAVRRRAVATYGVCAFVIGFALFAALMPIGISPQAALCGAASAGLLCLSFPLVLRLILRRRAKAMLRRKGQTLTQRRNFTLTSKGLRLWSGGFDKIYPYHTIKHIRVTKAYLALSIASENTLLLPVRAFETVDLRDQFQQQLEQRLTERGDP